MKIIKVANHINQREIKIADLKRESGFFEKLNPFKRMESLLLEHFRKEVKPKVLKRLSEVSEVGDNYDQAQNHFSYFVNEIKSGLISMLNRYGELKGNKRAMQLRNSLYGVVNGELENYSSKTEPFLRRLQNAVKSPDPMTRFQAFEAYRGALKNGASLFYELVKRFFDEIGKPEAMQQENLY